MIMKGGRAHTANVLAIVLFVAVFAALVAMVVLVDETERLRVSTDALLAMIDSRLVWLLVAAILGPNVNNWIDAAKEGRGIVEKNGGGGGS